MRYLFLAAAALLGLTGITVAQNQIQYDLDCVLESPARIVNNLNAKKKTEWCEQRTQKYLKLLQGVGFWKFAVAKPPKRGTLVLTVRTDSASKPGLEVSLDVWLPGAAASRHLWDKSLIPSAELSALLDSGEEAALQLEHITEKLDSEIQKDLRVIILRLFEVAYVADGVVSIQQDCEVALPLLWAGLAGSAQSVYRIECNTQTGIAVSPPIRARGVAHPFSHRTLGDLLLARSERSLKGLKPQKVFVIYWQDGGSSNSGLDIAGDCP
jgi:hypothetical protein